VLWSARIPKVQGHAPSREEVSDSSAKSGRYSSHEAVRRLNLRVPLSYLYSLPSPSDTFRPADSGPPASKHPLFPLKLSANKRYLVDQNDTPFLHRCRLATGTHGPAHGRGKPNPISPTGKPRVQRTGMDRRCLCRLRLFQQTNYAVDTGRNPAVHRLSAWRVGLQLLRFEQTE